MSDRLIMNVHATVSTNSLGYFRYMRANYTALTSARSELRFFAYCLDRRCARVLAGERSVDKLIEMPFGRGSTGHAMAIEAAISNFVPGEFNITADTDTVLLKQDWDCKLIDVMLEHDTVGMIGITYEDIAGFSSGSQQIQSYKRKPTVTWMAMSPSYSFRGLSVLPDKTNPLVIADERLSQLYNLPIGCQLLKDVGWQIPSFLDQHNIPYFALDIVKPSAPQAKALAGTNPYHDEFQWDGEPFLAHQRGSMTHFFRIDPLSVDFYDACDRYLGNPSWAVFPTVGERAAALARGAWRESKRLVRRALNAARAR